MSDMTFGCAFCGEELASANTKHAIADCADHLKAALAERDRMLRLLVPEFVHGVERSAAGIDDCDSCKHVIADLRARAEEGGE